MIEQKRRGRPCKCIERGIACKHQPKKACKQPQPKKAIPVETPIELKRRGRPCKCAERGIACKHRTAVFTAAANPTPNPAPVEEKTPRGSGEQGEKDVDKPKVTAAVGLTKAVASLVRSEKEFDGWVETTIEDLAAGPFQNFLFGLQDYRNGVINDDELTALAYRADITLEESRAAAAGAALPDLDDVV